MNNRIVYLKDLIKEKGREDNKPQVILGKDSKGEIVTKELDNLLISGHTHSGKSMFLNSVIYTLLNTSSSEDVELVLIDTKFAGFYIYKGIKYLRGKVNQFLDESIDALKGCVLEIERRKKENVNSPNIVILIDEFAVIGEPISEELICRIAKEGKEVGIYIILSSSMASERVFTEKIRDSISKRLVGSVVSKEDSLLLLNEEGAEKLLGNGDMIFKDMDTKESIRVQTPYISIEDQKVIINTVSKVSEYKEIQLKENREEIDSLYEDAKKIVIMEQKASASLLQRRLKIGYNNAARLIEQLEVVGVIGPQIEVNPRKVLVHNHKIEEETNPLLEDAKRVVAEYGFFSVPLLYRELKIGWNRARRLYNQLKNNNGYGKESEYVISKNFLNSDNLKGEDPLFEDAKMVVVMEGKASAFILQSMLNIGFDCALRLMGELEKNEVIIKRELSDSWKVLLTKKKYEAEIKKRDIERKRGVRNEYTQLTIEEKENLLYEEAIKLVIDEKKVSASLLQERLGIGYNTTMRLIERLEGEGIISKIFV